MRRSARLKACWNALTMGNTLANISAATDNLTRKPEYPHATREDTPIDEGLKGSPSLPKISTIAVAANHATEKRTSPHNGTPIDGGLNDSPSLLASAVVPVNAQQGTEKRTSQSAIHTDTPIDKTLPTNLDGPIATETARKRRISPPAKCHEADLDEGSKSFSTMPTTSLTAVTMESAEKKREFPATSRNDTPYEERLGSSLTQSTCADKSTVGQQSHVIVAVKKQQVHSAVMSWDPSGTYLLKLPGFSPKHPSFSEPKLEHIVFHLSESSGSYWGALMADDDAIDVSLKVQRLPIDKRPTFSFTWCGHREDARALIGPSCTGIFHFDFKRNEIVGHFKTLFGFRTEFVGHRETTAVITSPIPAKMEEHWNLCHERLASFTNIEEKRAKKPTEDELIASFVAGDSFIDHTDLSWDEKNVLIQQTRSYYLSTSHNISRTKFQFVAPQHLALQDMTLCRDEDAIMWGSFKIQNTKGILRFSQFAYPPNPGMANSYTFEWYGIETVGNNQIAMQRSVRRGTGYILFEEFEDTFMRGRFNPPEGADLTTFCSPGGLADTGYWNASWQQPYDFYGYANDAKEGFYDDISAGRRIFRSIPMMKGEWDAIRALWDMGPKGVDTDTRDAWGLRKIVPGEPRPDVVIGIKGLERRIARWERAFSNEGKEETEGQEGSEGNEEKEGNEGKKRTHEDDDEESNEKHRAPKKRKVRFAPEAVAEPRKSTRERRPTVRYGA